MTGIEYVERLEAGSKVPSRRLAPPEIGPAFFNRVIHLYGSDPSACTRLASKWPKAIGHSVGDALVFRARGVGQLASGKWRLAAQSFVEASKTIPEFGIAAVDAYARAGDPETALFFAKRLKKRLASSPIEQARLNVNIGNMWLQADRVKTADQFFRSAITPLEDDPNRRLDLGKAVLGRASCALFLGDSETAHSMAKRAQVIFEEAGASYHAHEAAIALAQVQILTGNTEAGLTTLLSLREEMSEGHQAWLLDLCGDAYMRLNLHEDALESEMLALSLNRIPNATRANSLTTAAQAMFALGQSSQAKACLVKARRIYRKLDNRAMSAIATLTLASGAAGDGDWRKVMSLCVEAEQVLTQEGWQQFAALVHLLRCEAAAEIGQKIDPKIPRRFQQDPNLRWRLEYVQGLLTVGARRRRHFRAMFASMLQARSASNSLTTRMAVFADKRRALGVYLSELVAAPSKANVTEIWQVLYNSRSVALLDEIAGGTVQFTQEEQKALDDLRASLISSGASDLAVKLQRKAPEAMLLRKVASRWRELSLRTKNQLGEVSSVRPQPFSGAIAIIDLPDGLRILHSSKITSCSATAKVLAHTLSKWRFLLIEPIVDALASPDASLQVLADLTSQIGLPEDTTEICPHDRGWSIPWHLLNSQTPGGGTELPLTLSPSLSDSRSREFSLGKKKMLIWIPNDPSLANLEAEYCDVVRLFPNHTICRTRTEAIASLSTGPYDLMHVATHGHHRHSAPMLSSLVFPDGELFAAEIARSDLRVGLATIFSCDSGKVSTLANSEPDGLVRAFLARGTQDVLASAWPLSDEIAPALAFNWYAKLLAGDQPEVALNKARTKIRRSHPHPFFWGAPVLFRGRETSPAAIR